MNLPSGTNTPGASSVPFVVSGTPGAAVTYTFKEGTSTSLRHRCDRCARHVRRRPRPLRLCRRDDLSHDHTHVGREDDDPHRTMGKNSVAPPAPTVTAAAFANIANSPVFNVTVTGQAGSIANVIVSDGATPVVNYANGMDFVGAQSAPSSSRSISSTCSTVASTISVTTNGAGDFERDEHRYHEATILLALLAALYQQHERDERPVHRVRQGRCFGELHHIPRCPSCLRPGRGSSRRPTPRCRSASALLRRALP